MFQQAYILDWDTRALYMMIALMRAEELVDAFQVPVVCATSCPQKNQKKSSISRWCMAWLDP